jgi:hypothetical protein
MTVAWSRLAFDGPLREVAGQARLHLYPAFTASA